MTFEDLLARIDKLEEKIDVLLETQSIQCAEIGRDAQEAVDLVGALAIFDGICQIAEVLGHPYSVEEKIQCDSQMLQNCLKYARKRGVKIAVVEPKAETQNTADQLSFDFNMKGTKGDN